MVQHLSLNEIPSGHTSFVEALTGTNLKKLSMRNLRNTDVSKMDLLCRYAVFSIFFLFFAFLTATSFFKKGFLRRKKSYVSEFNLSNNFNWRNYMRRFARFQKHEKHPLLVKLKATAHFRG